MKNQIFKKAFAFTCLFSLLTEVVYPTIIFSGSRRGVVNSQSGSAGGSEPIANAANGMVDLYTGDFRYGVPLMTVPGPNGESVDISLNYHGGIRVNEKASWVGLGWDYNPGEISRSVVGVADDYSGQPVYTSTIGIAGGETSGGVNSQLMYGPFNYEKMTSSNLYPYGVTGFGGGWRESTDMLALENPISPQTYSTTVINHNSLLAWNGDTPPRFFGKPTAPVEVPAYDQYFISGPGISGKLRPYSFTGIELGKDNVPSSAINATKAKTQFYFDNSTNKNVWGASDGGLNNRIKSGYFIKYYTNSEINNTSNLFNNTSQTGFLDYRTITGTRRPSSDFDDNGIGGIEVTDPTGITYHYSLPVYTMEELAKTLHYTNAALNDINLTSSNILKMGVTYKKFPYATSWKLTSVTGPDYQDMNGNKMVDEGDKGYWIAYNYSMWNPEHISTTNVYNASEFYIRQQSRLNRLEMYGGYIPPTFQKSYNIGQSKNQVYYLNNIKTATHTAFFVKDIRLDEHSYDNVLYTSAKPFPLLKLSRIILLRNQDKALIQNTAAWNMTNVDSRFNTSLCTSPYDANLIHIDKYISNKSLIDSKSLQSVELKTDYSLCKKLYNNINNTFSSGVTRVIWGTGNGLLSYNCNSYLGYATYNKASGTFSTTDANNSGKLTLNEIQVYEDGGVKLSPSYVLDYDKTSSSKNPDFDPEKTDFWGFYKSDYTGFGCSHYTTPTSATDVDAWSLKQIVTPIGEKIQIEYEPDEYVKEGYNDDPYNPLWLAASNPPKCMPTIVYPINTYNSSNTAMTFIYNDYHTIYSSSYSAGTNRLLNYYVLPRQTGCSTWLSSPPTWNTILTYEQGVARLPATVTSIGVNNSYLFTLGFEHNNGTAMVLGTVEKPSVYNFGCAASSEIDYGYDKTNAPGYVMMKFKKLYGGGTRVKSITISDPDYSTDIYKQQFTYQNGYCPVVPVPFMFGPQTNFTQFMLWDNLKMLLPENGGSQVGYDAVTVSSMNKYGESNGFTEHKFENAPINNPIQSVVISAPKYTNNATCSPYSACVTNPTLPNWAIVPIQRSHHVYNLQSTISNEEVKMLGKLKSTTVYNKLGSIISGVSYAYDNNKLIKEGYWHNLNYNVNIPFTRTCFCLVGTTNISTNTCYDDEYYTYAFYLMNFTPSLKTITKTTDGIGVSSTFYYHPNFNDSHITINTSPTEPLTKIYKVYAFQGTPLLGRKDSVETCKNQLLLPSKIRTIRGSDNSMSFYSDGYLIDEKTITYTNSFNYRVYNSGTGLYENSSQAKNWYTQDEVSSRLLDDKTLGTNTSSGTYRVNNKSSLFNKDNTLLEEKGLNNRLSAVKFGYNNLYKISSITNANYNSFTYSSYEDTITVASGVRHFGGEINGGQYRCTSEYAKYNPVTSAFFTYYIPDLTSLVNPHTGTFVAKVPPSTYGPTYNGRNIDINRRYRAQVWVHKQSPNDAKLVLSLTGTDLSNNTVNLYTDIAKNNSANVQVGDWTLMSVELDVPANLDLTKTHNLAAYVRNFNATTNAYFDDFKLHPVDAPITGNVYDLRTGRVTATLDEENYFTQYNYDAAGRITSVYKETKSNGVVKILEKGYHNSRP